MQLAPVPCHFRVHAYSDPVCAVPFRIALSLSLLFWGLCGVNRFSQVLRAYWLMGFPSCSRRFYIRTYVRACLLAVGSHRCTSCSWSCSSSIPSHHPIPLPIHIPPIPFLSQSTTPNPVLRIPPSSLYTHTHPHPHPQLQLHPSSCYPGPPLWLRTWAWAQALACALIVRKSVVQLESQCNRLPLALCPTRLLC